MNSIEGYFLIKPEADPLAGSGLLRQAEVA